MTAPVDLDFSCFAAISRLPMRVTYSEFKRLRDDLGEYSCSIPSGVISGKRWLRCEPYRSNREPFKKDSGEWLLFEYGPARMSDRGEVCDVNSIALLIERDSVSP